MDPTWFYRIDGEILLSGPANYPCTEYGPEWQSGLNYGISDFQPVLDNRSYWGTFDLIFSDYG
jgi:hypothetical protein